MKHWNFLGIALLCGFAINVHAQSLALVYDQTNDVEMLAEVDGTGALTPFGTGIVNCCSVSGALATRNNASVFFVGTTTGSATQTLQVLDGNTGDSVQAGIDFPNTLSVLGLRWDDGNDRLLALTMTDGTDLLQLSSVDVATAALTPIGTGIVDCCGVGIGVDVLDPDNQQWHITAQPVSTAEWRIFTMDLATGDVAMPSALLSQPPVSLTLDTDLFAVYHDASLPGERLAVLDAASGAYSDIGAGLNDCCFAAQGVATLIDSAVVQVARPDAASGFAFFSADVISGAIVQQNNVPANMVINAMLGEVDSPVIVQGASVDVMLDEDNTPTPFALTLDSSDPKGGGLIWSISTPASMGVASVTTGIGLSQVINYTANADVNGTDSFVVQVTDIKGDFDQITVNAIINPINDAPSFVIGPNQISNEDQGPQSVANWVTAISAGPANEAGQVVQFNSNNDNNALFTVQPSVAMDGTLSYTAALDAFGMATVMVQAMDDGGTASGGVDTSPIQMATITINPVNDVPSFVAGPNETVLEDAGAQTVANWAFNITPGPANEGGQVLSFIVSNNNAALFSQPPTVDAASGTLTYTAADDAVGTALVDVQLMDDGGIANGGVNISAVQQFSITVDAVNDAPSFTPGPDQGVLEDAGPQAVTWATNIDPGAPDEVGQALTFIVSNDNNTLFSVQPAIDAAGMLTYTAVADEVGSAIVSVQLMDDGGTANGGMDTSPLSQFAINVAEVNDAPSFTAGPDQVLLKDLGPQTVPGWATNISPGPASEVGQTVNFIVTNDNNGLFSQQPSIDASGTLTFTSAPDINGIAMVDVMIMDDGGTANGGVDTSPVQQFMINIEAVNDAPSFVVGPDVFAVDQDPPQVISPWATAISAGPPDESGQALTFNIVGNTDPSLFAVQPTVAPDGTLSFTPMLGTDGDSLITLELMDDGGTANGGEDTSPTQSFTITVGPAMTDLILTMNSVNVPLVIHPFVEFDIALDLVNNGPQNATNVVTEVTLSPQLEFVSAMGGCANLVGGLVVWNLPMLANGINATCVFTVQVTGLGALTAVGTTTGDQLDPDPVNNTDITLVEVLESVPLEVPALSSWSLLLLALALLVLGWSNRSRLGSGLGINKPD